MRADSSISIGMAAEAELISLGLEGKLADSPDQWKKSATGYLQQVYPRYAEKTANNPFSAVIDTADVQANAALFHRIADQVAY